MPQLHTKLSESERQRMVDEVLEKLEREGYLERVPGKVDPVEGQAWRWTKKRPPGAEALIPDNLLDYRDPYDGRWRGDKPYIGLGNAVRDKITEDLWTSVRWLRPGDLVDGYGVYQWTEKHFPGHDPYMDDGVHDVTGRAIRSLVKHGFLHTDSDFVFTRTSKPPHTAYSISSIDASCWPDTNGERTKRLQKRVAEDREILRGRHTEEVVNTAYDEGPTLEQYRFLDRLDPWERPHKLTDADFMNPSPELLAKVEARNEHYRLIREKSAAKQAETERCHALIERHKQAYLASNNTWAPALQKLLANRGLSFAAYVQQQRRGDETITDALVRVLDGIETKTQQEESAPWE
jgi:hypothetical protein